MKKTIRDYELNDKKVIIRCDFNVPIKNGIIQEDNRIIESLETIKYAIDNQAKVILMSHLGRVKEEKDKKNNTLKPVAIRLSELLNQEVIFIPLTRGKKLENAIKKLENGQVLLIENTRFEDIKGKLESSNNSDLGKYWATFGDVFINDAFGTSHRSHASNVGIASNLPNGIGFLIEKELKNIETVINNPKKPFTVILGGAKVSDKIKVISNLVKKADYILIGGGMSYTFLNAQGFNIGRSLLDLDSIEFCKQIIKDYPDKIILPVDIICGLGMNENTVAHNRLINEIDSDEMGLDIGPKTIDLFKRYLLKSKTVIWNGPLGVFEIERFAKGTKEVCKILSNIDATTIIGGGDTGSAVINMGFKDSFTHISTGGGASLAMLEGETLSGIGVINDK